MDFGVTSAIRWEMPRNSSCHVHVCLSIGGDGYDGLLCFDVALWAGYEIDGCRSRKGYGMA